MYLKFAHLINNKEYCWIKLSILFLSFCRVRYVVVASAFKWKFVYTHLIFWVTTVYFAFCLCYQNKRIKTEFSGISWIPNLLVMSLVAFLHFVPCTRSKLQWLMVPSKTYWDTETFVLACITGVLWAKRGEHGISCQLRSPRLAHKGPVMQEEARTCRKTFEILRTKQTCEERISVLYTLNEPKISNLYPSAGLIGPSCKEMTMKDACIRLIRENGKTTSRYKIKVTSAGHCSIDK